MAAHVGNSHAVVGTWWEGAFYLALIPHPTWSAGVGDRRRYVTEELRRKNSENSKKYRQRRDRTARS